MSDKNRDKTTKVLETNCQLSIINYQLPGASIGDKIPETIQDYLKLHIHVKRSIGWAVKYYNDNYEYTRWQKYRETARRRCHSERSEESHLILMRSFADAQDDNFKL